MKRAGALKRIASSSRRACVPGTPYLADQIQGTMNYIELHLPGACSRAALTEGHRRGGWARLTGQPL